MKPIDEFTNKIICGNTLDILKQMPDEFIDCVITSPPYWSLRNYKTEPVIWGGDIFLTCVTCNGIIRIDKNYIIKEVIKNGARKTNKQEKLEMSNLWKNGNAILQNKKTQPMAKKKMDKRNEMETRKRMLQKSQYQNSSFGRQNKATQSEIQHGSKQYQLERRYQDNTRRIQDDISEKSPKQCEGICNGTSAHTRENDRQIFREERICPSYQRNKGRQSSRKSSISNQPSSQGTGKLSFLSQDLRNKLTCPICQSDNLIKKNCEHIWISEITKKPNMSGGHTDFVKSKGQENYKENVDYHNRVIQSNFCQKCGAWKGQLGLEPNPEMFIEHLVSIFDEIKRVLKKTGGCWINISDTYWGSPSHRTDTSTGPWKSKRIYEATELSHRQDPQKYGGKSGVHCLRGKGIWNYQPKCLCMIPERFAIKMAEHDWILRNKIIWAKPNPMPSSVKDRFSNTWEYVYFFSKSKKYYFDLDAVREPLKEVSNKFNYRVRDAEKKSEFCLQFKATQQEIERYKEGRKRALEILKERGCQPTGIGPTGFDHNLLNNPKGKNPGDVWKIPTQSFKDAHFATFPEKLCIKPILAGCEKSGIVLDPFCGSGTACMVAKKLGRQYIGIDLSENYSNMARQRILKECGGLF